MTAADRLKSLADRILKLMDERDAIGGDIKDVFQEVKSAGFNSAALRKVIAAMRMDAEKREALEFDINAYRLAVGLERAQAEEMLADGAGIRETHRATGAPLATLHRRSASRAKTKNGTRQTDRAGTDDGAPEGQAARGGESQPPRPDLITTSAAGAAGHEDVLAADPSPPVAPPAPCADSPTPAADTVDAEYLADAARNYTEAVSAIRAGILERGEARLPHPADVSHVMPLRPDRTAADDAGPMPAFLRRRA